MKTKHILLLFILVISPIFIINAQTLKKAPNQYSLEMGYRNLFYHSDNIVMNNMHGYGALLDYAWQLGGLDGSKNASFISVPIGYTILPAGDNTSKQISMLNYGWTVRHELSRNKQIIPFVGYGLLLNNLRIADTEGSVFGHQTEFDFGLNFKTNSKLSYFVKLQYSYTSYPKLGDPQRIKFHFADIRFGFRL